MPGSKGLSYGGGVDAEKAGGPVLQVTSRSRVFGLIGYPVGQSLSPVMYNRAFAVMGYPGIYVAFPVEPGQVEAAVHGIRALGLGGGNVTAPHKRAVMPFLDEIRPAARRMGAVNTILCREGRLIGDNTDGQGFLRSLREELGVDPRGARVVILGAGGAARSITAAMMEAGAAKLTIANRTLAKAEALAQDLTARDGDASPGPSTSSPALLTMALDDPSLEAMTNEADILIHASTWGMNRSPAEPPLIPASWLRPQTIVCDIVYSPLETGLLREARERGCPVLPGLGMLLYQGVIALEEWTGQSAPVDEMREALLQGLR